MKLVKPGVKLLAVALAAALAHIVVVGCGGDDGDEGAETTTEFAAEDVTATIEVKMDEFKFIPMNAQGPAGIDEVVTPNIGQVEHELQLYKTDIGPASLEVDPETNKADTAPLGERLFETFAEAGETDSAIAELTPGKYAMICNIPGHYAAGMRGTLTIK